MTVIAKTAVKAAAIGCAAAACLMLGAGPALAAGPEVVNRETVLVELSPSGEIQHARLFSQLSLVGDGKVTVLDPTATHGLRNLDGFGKPSVVNGSAKFTLNSDGASEARTVADFDRNRLPVTVRVDYRLNGKPIKPGDLVGKTGRVQATYRVQNVSGTPTQISYRDGKGNTINETVDVVTPYVGQLTTVLPKSFSRIDSPRADIAGDGRGGSQLVWTMVLFSPIGQVEQEFGWEAEVKDAIAPAAVVQVIPVPPSRKPELKFGEDGFEQGAHTGAELTDGATQIDANLVKLRDGASQLLSGLTQLSDGANRLRAGLADEAAPGSRRLRDGLAQAAGGADELAMGLKDAHSGSGELSAGLSQAHAGSEDLADGLAALAGGTAQLSEGFHSSTGQQDLISGSQDLASALGLISGGLNQLASVDGIPAIRTGAVALKAGVDKILAGIGDPTTTGTILNGLSRLSTAASALDAGLAKLQGASGLGAAKGGVDQVKAGLDAALASGGDIDTLAAYITALKGYCNPAAQAQCEGTIDGIVAGISTSPTGLKAKTAAAAQGLGQVSVGLQGAIGAIGDATTDGTLRNGVAQISGGLLQVTAGVNQVRAGLRSGDPAHPGISEGLDQLITGLDQAIAGLGQLAPGSKAASDGAGTLAQKLAEAGDGAARIAAGAAAAALGSDELAGGLGQLDAGGKQLADGLGDAASGSGDLADGLDQLHDGSGQLADGLGDAADGAGQLADGLGKAKDGGGQISDGATRLQAEGTAKLVEAGDHTTKEFGREAAIMRALNEKAASGALPYGAPEGTSGSAAYAFQLAAATGEGGRNAARGLVALGAFAVAGLAGTVLHRRQQG